jgi:hypothetical protein
MCVLIYPVEQFQSKWSNEEYKEIESKPEAYESSLAEDLPNLSHHVIRWPTEP